MNKKGFTLTELIAVIVIIGVVLVIVIPVIGNNINDNKKKKCEYYVETVEKAIITYKDIKGYNPNSYQDLIDGGFIEALDKNDGIVFTNNKPEGVTVFYPKEVTINNVVYKCYIQ